MAKNIDSNLVADILIETGEAIAPTKAVALNVFAKDFSDETESYANGKFKTAKIAFTDVEPQVAVNPAEFGKDESSNTTGVEVGIDLLSAPISANWNDPVSIKQYVTAALQALVKKMTLTATSLFTTSAFGTSRQVTADIAGCSTDAEAAQLLKSLYKSTKEGINKYLIGDSDLYSLALPSNLQGFNPSVNGGYGFDKIYENNIWGAESNVKGIVTDGRAVAMVARLPEWSEMVKSGLNSEVIYIPSLDLSVQFNKWCDLNGRIDKASLDIAFGAAILDKSATKIVLQA